MRVRRAAARAATSTPTRCATFLTERVAKWWVPDRVEFIDEVPKTSVGKFDKKVLRRRLADGGARDGPGALPGRRERRT